MQSTTELFLKMYNVEIKTVKQILPTQPPFHKIIENTFTPFYNVFEYDKSVM